MQQTVVKPNKSKSELEVNRRRRLKKKEEEMPVMEK